MQVGCPSVASYGARHAKQSPDLHRAKGQLVPLLIPPFISVHHIYSDSRHSSLTLAEVFWLFKHPPLLAFQGVCTAWLVKFDPGLFVFMQLTGTGVAVARCLTPGRKKDSRSSAKFCNRNRNLLLVHSYSGILDH